MRGIQRRCPACASGVRYHQEASRRHQGGLARPFTVRAPRGPTPSNRSIAAKSVHDQVIPWTIYFDSLSATSSSEAIYSCCTPQQPEALLPGQQFNAPALTSVYPQVELLQATIDGYGASDKARKLLVYLPGRTEEHAGDTASNLMWLAYWSNSYRRCLRLPACRYRWHRQRNIATARWAVGSWF